MVASWHTTDWRRAAPLTRRPTPDARLLPLWDAAPTLPPRWLETLAPRPALCLLAVERWGVGYAWLAAALACGEDEIARLVYSGREALRLAASVPPCAQRRRVSRAPAAPRSLLRGLLGPGVWLLALAGVGAALAGLFALALVASLEVSVQLAEAVAAVVAGGGSW